MKQKPLLFSIVFLLILFLVSFFLRLYGLFDNIPFWPDEFFSASQANVFLKYGLGVLNNPKVYLEYHNIIPHILIAVFFKFLGQQEWVARLPFIIIGSLVPIMVFIFARKIFDLPTAVSGSLLTVFSYLQITWSRQARGYVLQQLLVLLTFYLYRKIVSRKNNSFIHYLLLFILFLLGILTHSTFLILIAAIFFHHFIFNPHQTIILLKNKLFYLSLILFILITYKIKLFSTVVYFFQNKTFGTNNLWYYHSFLWREYGLITFLALIGLIVGLFKKTKEISVILLYFIFYFSFLIFIFKPYVSRYLLVVFPLLFIATGLTITQISSILASKSITLLNDRTKVLLAVFLTLFIIGNGYKFVNKPKKYYSINHDFREIANIDYHQVYRLIKNKIQMEKQPVAIIETLPDRAGWYLGYDYQPIYLFRWGNVEGFVNGLAKRTAYAFNREGEKVLFNTNLKLVTDLIDLKKVMERYSRGFIFIDDWSMSQDVINYAKKSLKQEIYLDRYPLDDNPYSIWPATLYSWGLD